MDQGLRRASAACILLILGIGLQHNSQAADVIFFNQSFGPFFLQDSQIPSQTKNTQKPAAESFPVTPPSTESHPPEISSFQSLLIEGVEQVTTEVAVREEDLSMIHSEKPTSSGTESPILYSSVNTNEASEISAQNSEIEKSLVNQTGPPSSVSAEIPPISEDEYCIETEIYTLSEDLPVSTTQSEFLISSSVVWNSKMESSMVTLQPSLISQFGINEEHTLEVFSGQNRPSSEIAINLQSSYLQSKINSEDATSIPTRKALQSVFLNIGLSAANELSTSPYSTPFSTAVELPYLEYGVFSSEDLDFPATSPLMKNYESTMAAYSTPVPTLTLYNDQTLILSSHVVSTDLMKNDLDSITFKPVESSGYSLHSSLFSEKEHFEASATEELYGLYSSMFPLSSTHGEGFVPSLDFTSLVDTSLIGNPATTHLHVYNTDLETNIFFVLDSSVYMPSLTEIVSATTFVDFDSDPSTSIHIAASKTFTEHSFSTSMNTVEAAAFVPTESVLYFSQSLIPLEESENINHHLSMMFTLEPSIPLPSLSEDGLLSSSKSSESSVLLSQGSSIILATSELFLNSSLLEPSFSPTSESISFEGSGLMPWQTSNNYLAASLSPVSRIDEFEENSSVFSQPAELWEQTTALQSETDILYTSSFSGATSPLMPLSTPTSFTFPITELSAYSLDSNDYSTTLVEETIEPSFAFSHSLMLDLATTMSSFFETSTHTVVLPESTLPIPTITPAENLSEFPTGSIIPSTSLSEPNYMLSTPLIPTSPTNITDDVSSIFITVAPEATKDSNFTTTDATWIANPEITTTANASWTMISDVTSNTSSTTANALWTLSVEVTTNNSVVTVIPETNANITTEKMGWTEASETVTNTSIITATTMRTVTPAIITTSNTVGTVTREATTAHTSNEETTAITTENLTAASTQSSSTHSVPITPPSGLTAATSPTTTRQTLVCDVSNPEPYIVTAVLFRGSNIENAIESIKQMLTQQFNHSVELEVYTLSQRLSFIITSGPLVYTAIAVVNALTGSSLLLGYSPLIRSIETAFLGLDQRFHIQTVLQFVPRSVDIRLCTFSDQIQRGLSMALYEVRRLRQEDDNFSVQIVNITSSMSRELFWKAPVTVSYAVKERNSFLNGSEVSEQLRNLSLVEFSFFLGYPVKQIAEPSRYPQLNVSPLLKESWLRTVLLGVMEPKFRDEAFQAEMERKLAQLIIEATARKRRWKRASVAGGNTVQVVNITRLDGSDDPVQLIYFIEDQYGERLSAARASDLINEVNIQRAAIILGYRVQGAVSQPLDQPLESDQQAQNLWIIVGVAVPVLLVTVIIVILYWKLCRSDKLDFQPDTMSNLQQRQKLQAPSVKGFDFAKQHLGQHNKDEVLVVHEPPPPVLHGPLKDSTPSENGDVPTPKSKSSSKPPKVGRHRGSRVTPSDAGSSASDASSGKESAGEGSPRPSAPPRETKPRSSINRDLPAIITGNEQHSSASIFEHVDRISRSSEASRRFPSKIQLIAMQPITAPPMHGLSMSEREMEANKINREIQTTLRHKSEIEHHRNKIRLRAKRKGHYEFPLVDVVGMTDTKERQRMYRKVQMQFDKILDPGSGIPTVFIEPRRSSRTRRSPKQRRRQQGSGSPSDADRDRLINTDSDGTYKRPPGVSNSAYVSDPDLPSDNPTPVSDLGKFPGSSLRAPPAQYVAPQPSIEEVRQTMQSLLDNAFALVAPSSQTAGGTGGGQTGGSSGPISSSTARTGRGTAPWSSAYPQQTTHFNRFTDYGMTQASAPSHMTRSPGFGSGFLPPGEIAQTEAEQAESQYNTRGMYSEEIASVARPRPLGSTSGSSQIHQLAQVGIASRMGAQTEMPPSRVGQAPTAGTGWSQYCHRDEEVSRNVHHRETGHSHGSQDYGAPQMFPLNRAPARQPGNNTHVPPPICYPSGSAEDLHPGHSSASLIKAIREELLRLSQKHAVVPTYHS